MSGECYDCGNVICLCDELESEVALECVFYDEGYVNKLKAKLEKAISALEFYGSIINWELGESASCYIASIISSDCEQIYPLDSCVYGGKRARQAIQEITKEVE